MTKLRGAGLALAAVVLTGCGSTLQAGAGTSSSGLIAPIGVGQIPSGHGGSAPSAPGGAAVMPGSMGASGTRTSGAGPAQPTAHAPAVSSLAALANKQPVKVGVLYLEGADQAFSAMGISGLTTGDTKAQAAAVVSWVNAHGGLIGHAITPYYYAINTADAEADPETAYQAACTAFTQDEKVRYVITIVEMRPSAMTCFAKAGVGLLDDESGLTDGLMAQYASYFAAPGDIAVGRLMKVLVDDLWAQGWLTATSKVGSLTTDTPEGQQVVDGALTQALKAHGLRIVSKQAVNGTDAGASNGSSVVLQFRAAGVDRVIPALISPLFVMEAASSQGYHPRWSLYSVLAPGALIEGTAPKDELAGSYGVGWEPYADIGAGKHPGPVSPNESLCFGIMKAGGQASTSATVQLFELQVCNALFYLQFAASRLPTIPVDLLSRTRPMIGKSFRPADTFRSDVSHRPDGVAAFRSLAYETSCSCFQYVSPLKETS